MWTGRAGGRDGGDHDHLTIDDGAASPRPLRGNPLPGLLAAAGMGAAALLVASRAHALPAPLVALFLGACLAPALRKRPGTATGLAKAAGPGLRLGVALLGLQVGVDQLLGLGPWSLLLAGAVVGSSVATAELAGRRLGVGRPMRLLIGSGFGICGASAVAATRDAAEADDHDVALAVALVTVCGTLAVIALPLLRPLVAGLESEETFGVLVGASVHDVAQVVAAASVAGSVALQTAIVVKLARVVLLAPTVAGIAAATGAREHRVTPLPWFIALFLVLIGVRSLVAVPTVVIDGARTAQNLLLAAALAAIGARTSATTFRRLRPEVIALSAVVWLAILTVSGLGVWLRG